MNWRFWIKPREEMPATTTPDWERAFINKLAIEHLREQRRARRWGALF